MEIESAVMKKVEDLKSKERRLAENQREFEKQKHQEIQLIQEQKQALLEERNHLEVMREEIEGKMDLQYSGSSIGRGTLSLKGSTLKHTSSSKYLNMPRQLPPDIHSPAQNLQKSSHFSYASKKVEDLSIDQANQLDLLLSQDFQATQSVKDEELKETCKKLDLIELTSEKKSRKMKSLGSGGFSNSSSSFLDLMGTNEVNFLDEESDREKLPPSGRKRISHISTI